MAWLQNLADKAEDLLNKVDKNAATVLSKEKKQSDKTSLQQSSSFAELSQDSDNSLNKGSSGNLSLIAKDLPEESVSQVDQVDTGINITFNDKKPSVSQTEEIVEKPLRSDRSVSSKSSSLHNSFLLAEETESLHERIAKIEFENQDLNKQLLNIQHLYSQLRNENGNLLNQIERLNEQISFAQQEKEQYIARAQRILQEKEKLISLKNENSSPEETENIFANYNEELKRELQFQQEKNNELVEKNKKLLNDVQSLQMQNQIIQNGLQQSNLSLEKSLQQEREFRRTAEEECQRRLKELDIRNQQLNSLQELLQNKTSEVTQLQVALKQKGNITNEDLESRIQSLTETLMVKQNSLEAISSERNALKLQVEKLEILQKEYRQNIAQLQRSQVKVVNVPENADMRPQVPHFMRVSPMDAGVTRRVKHAYSTVDAISVRTGIFLRRYPIARVAVFCYMVLLQIWVLIILFLYAPSNR